MTMIQISYTLKSANWTRNVKVNSKIQTSLFKYIEWLKYLEIFINPLIIIYSNNIWEKVNIKYYCATAKQVGLGIIDLGTMLVGWVLDQIYYNMWSLNKVISKMVILTALIYNQFYHHWSCSTFLINKHIRT